MRYILLLGALITSLSVYGQSKSTYGNRKKAEHYDRHIASFTPFSGNVSYKKFNPGAGIDYEYLISPENGIGVHIPIIIGYAGPDQSDFGFNEYRHTSIHAAPGIRFHTGRQNSEVDFITGPSLLIGNLHFKPTDDNFNPTIQRDPYDYGMLGLMADNTLNFYRRHFVFGIDVRLGAMFEEQDDTRFFIHFGIHFGGKF